MQLLASTYSCFVLIQCWYLGLGSATRWPVLTTLFLSCACCLPVARLATPQYESASKLCRLWGERKGPRGCRQWNKCWEQLTTYLGESAVLGADRAVRVRACRGPAARQARAPGREARVQAAQAPAAGPGQAGPAGQRVCGARGVAPRPRVALPHARGRRDAGGGPRPGHRAGAAPGVLSGFPILQPSAVPCPRLPCRRGTRACKQARVPCLRQPRVVGGHACTPLSGCRVCVHPFTYQFADQQRKQN